MTLFINYLIQLLLSAPKICSFPTASSRRPSQKSYCFSLRKPRQGGGWNDATATNSFDQTTLGVVYLSKRGRSTRPATTLGEYANTRRQVKDGVWRNMRTARNQALLRALPPAPHPKTKFLLSSYRQPGQHATPSKLIEQGAKSRTRVLGWFSFG